MSEHDFYQVYKDLGFEVKPLPDNYDPDTYGRSLMTANNEFYDVSYASSTDYVYAVK